MPGVPVAAGVSGVGVGACVGVGEGAAPARSRAAPAHRTRRRSRGCRGRRCWSRRRCCPCRRRWPCCGSSSRMASKASRCRLDPVGVEVRLRLGPRLISMLLTNSSEARDDRDGVAQVALQPDGLCSWVRCLPSWQRKQPGESQVADVVGVRVPVDLLVEEDAVAVRGLQMASIACSTWSACSRAVIIRVGGAGR